MRKQKRELLGERDNARNNARCMQVRTTTHGLDAQHQDMDRTPRGRVSQNVKGERQMEKVRPWCGRPSDRGRLKNRTVLLRVNQLSVLHYSANLYTSLICWGQSECRWIF